ncbi:MAG TPA: VacJ family lipoprotein [Burkholderiaceae bacterium]|nr:VacJ family lipoprotein [Burkholderiaceae bacterium]
MTCLLRGAVAPLSVVMAILISGCATVPADSGNDPRDPIESFNRQVFEFNDVVDRAVLKPVAQAYDYVLPEPVRDCISNIFSNFREPSNAVNNLLQGKPIDAASDTCRFVVNSTVGLLGCFDLARQMGLEKHNEDFGQTLGRWGIDSGPYLVVPILGPSTLRDAVGIYGAEPYLDVNFYINNVRVRNAIIGTRFVNQRAELLQTDDLISGAALDKYRFIRDGYLQRRRSLVYDGSPPAATDDVSSQPTPGGTPSADPSVKKEPESPPSGSTPASK